MLLTRGPKSCENVEGKIVSRCQSFFFSAVVMIIYGNFIHTCFGGTSQPMELSFPALGFCSKPDEFFSVEILSKILIDEQITAKGG